MITVNIKVVWRRYNSRLLGRVSNSRHYPRDCPKVGVQEIIGKGMDRLPTPVRETLWRFESP